MKKLILTLILFSCAAPKETIDRYRVTVMVESVTRTGDGIEIYIKHGRYRFKSIVPSLPDTVRAGKKWVMPVFRKVN